MATKKEQVTWIANDGMPYDSELEALTCDLNVAIYDADLDKSDPALTSDVLAAIDALHEYAHRADKPKAPVCRAEGVAVWPQIRGTYMPGDCPR